MKDYEVTLYYRGSHTFFVSAPDEDEAFDLAHDELADMLDMEMLEVIDSEMSQVDGGYDD